LIFDFRLGETRVALVSNLPALSGLPAGQSSGSIYYSGNLGRSRFCWPAGRQPGRARRPRSPGKIDEQRRFTAVIRAPGTRNSACGFRIFPGCQSRFRWVTTRRPALPFPTHEVRHFSWPCPYCPQFPRGMRLSGGRATRGTSGRAIAYCPHYGVHLRGAGGASRRVRRHFEYGRNP
jgi:hypothetical protein